VTDRPVQPPLHDLVGAALSPTSMLSRPDGQIRPVGVQGVFHADVRVLSRAELLVDGREPEPLTQTLDGPHGARFVSLARWLGDPILDPTVRIDRARRMVRAGLDEEISVRSSAAVGVRARITLHLDCDLASIEVVKSGGRNAPLKAKTTGSGQLVWAGIGTTVAVSGEGAKAEGGTAPGHPACLVWTVDLPPKDQIVLRWQLRVNDPQAAVVPPPREPTWSRPEVTADDRRLVRLVARSLDDLRALRLADAEVPGDSFLAAGVPWYLTLFGRDSLWAARMMLPLGTELAASTLRVLARRQGHRFDPESGEAPGKIMHELRRHDFSILGGRVRLPPVYYGTVDATPLWVILLHEAWRWGMPADEIEPLLPHLEAALNWLGEQGDPDGDGFVEYVDTSGHGLRNQGWKDSGDAVRFRDGRLAAAPIALVEVQGYAHAAARHGGDLLDAFGRPGGDRWRDYAGQLAEEFRARFWVDGRYGPQPALALDRDKRPVDSLTSNIGHLLGTGLLNDAESAQIAHLLTTDALAGGFGLRTMSSEDGGFNALSYHCGSIWVHDTAIALDGLARVGLTRQARALAEGVLTAAEAFGYRLPELYGGDDRATLGRPAPYPAACRPQAWTAAAGVALLQAATGLYPDVPGGRVRLRPLAGPGFGAVSVRRFRLAGKPVDVAVDSTGQAVVSGLPAGLTVEPEPAAPRQRSVEQRVEPDGEAGTVRH
jgi:glycogen debranching enzyme